MLNAARELTYGYSVRMREMQCCSCGTCFAAPEAMMNQRQITGDIFYCPNGHEQVYRESDASRYKKMLEDEQRRRFQTEIEKRELQRQIEKSKRRISFGICPCCNRSFAALGRHMKTKHPSYVASK